MALPATVRRAAERSTLELPVRIPAKDWFSLAEAAALCGMGESYMEKLFDAAEAEGRGQIFGHKHNAGTGARHTKRIPRLFLVAYLLRTATYDNDGLVDCLLGSLRHLSRAQMQRVHAGLTLYLDRNLHN